MIHCRCNAYYQSRTMSRPPIAIGSKSNKTLLLFSSSFSSFSQRPQISFLRPFHSSSSPSSPSLTLRHFAPPVKRYKNIKCNVASPGTPVPKRIAIVGGGLAGLSVAYHLLHSTSRWARKRNFDHKSIDITIFDPVHPGTGGASAAAAGLLHEFRPRPKNKIWNYQKGIDATLHLLSVAQANSHKQLLCTPGILKLAFDSRVDEDFKISAGRFPKEVEYLPTDVIHSRLPKLTQTPVQSALFIRNGHVVDTITYMKTLWEICQRSGRVAWSKQSIHSAMQLFNHNSSSSSSKEEHAFDNVVLCAGAAVKDFTDLKCVAVAKCLGRNLVMEKQQQEQHDSNIEDVLDTPLMSGPYIVPQRMPDSSSSSRIIVGATREYEFQDDDLNLHVNVEDIKKVKSALSERLNLMDPNLFHNYNVKAIQTGIRAIPPRRHDGAIPIVCQVQGTPEHQCCWVMTGLGGRGLIYHAFLGRRLAHAIVAGNESLIPGDTRKIPVHLKM